MHRGLVKCNGIARYIRKFGCIGTIMVYMDFELQPGKYVLAVSGGVDSVALLHALSQKQRDESQVSRTETSQPSGPWSPYSFVVAHFDHGIRPDSVKDRQLVQTLSERYRIPFVYSEGKLGPRASEAVARKARYDFLHYARRESGAVAIITAHHQDDVLETIILNLMRGTGRRGLSSLKSTATVRRPLLHIAKKELLRYAKREGLQWREDSTNMDQRYARNYIRKNVLPRFVNTDREALLEISSKSQHLDIEITQLTNDYLHAQPGTKILNRHSFIMLPHAVAREIMAAWLRANTDVELSRQLLERLVTAAKIGRSGSKTDATGDYWLCVHKELLELRAKSRWG